MKKLIIKPGKEKSLLRRHPWVFSGALTGIPKDVAAGETVDVVSRDGRFLGRGAVSPVSQIAVRIWTFDAEEEVGEVFFKARLKRAIEKRKNRMDQDRTACRLVNAESDGLPGVIVDRYADFLVIQCLSAGAEIWKESIVRELAPLFPCRGIYERSEADVRKKEGLTPRKGALMGDAPPEFVEIREGPVQFYVDLVNGHKTGFYLDQSENRAGAADFSSGAEVLNCFSYSGGFGMHALHGGARSLVNVELSETALSILKKNIALNGFDPSQALNIREDVFEFLRRCDRDGRRFDLIILDPPKFAESTRTLTRAARGYKDINRLAFKILRAGGILFTFSCSGLLEPALFQKIVADAALDAGRSGQIIRKLGQPPDHPVLLSFPEGAYLKGLICRAD